VFTIIFFGAIAVVALLFFAFLLLERAIAYKAAAGVIGLYLALIGLGYFQASFERNDAAFAKDQAEMKVNFAQAQKDFFKQLDGDGSRTAEEDAAKREQHLKKLEGEYAEASTEAKTKKDSADQKSADTKDAIEALRVRAKKAVDDDETYLPPANSKN